MEYDMLLIDIDILDSENENAVIWGLICIWYANFYSGNENEANLKKILSRPIIISIETSRGSNALS
jgi:hypothetical protein